MGDGHAAGTVTVRADTAVRLRFERQIPLMARSSAPALALDRSVNTLRPEDLGQVVLPPRKPGTYEYEFTCGAGVLHGQLVVK